MILCLVCDGHSWCLMSSPHEEAEVQRDQHSKIQALLSDSKVVFFPLCKPSLVGPESPVVGFWVSYPCVCVSMDVPVGSAAQKAECVCGRLTDARAEGMTLALTLGRPLNPRVCLPLCLFPLSGHFSVP